MAQASKPKTSIQGNEHTSARRVRFQATRKPISGALIDLEWARVYAGGIQVELKLIATAIVDHNLHVSNLELIRGAALLRAQMKRASKQIGEMRQASSRLEGSKKTEPAGRNPRSGRQGSGRSPRNPEPSVKHTDN